MAAFREHVTVSSLLGVTYGLGAAVFFQFPATPACLAGWLVAVSGMLPDLDLDTGRPAKEIFGLVGAIAPLMVIHPLLAWTGWSGDAETVMLLLVLGYLVFRYGIAYFVGRLSIHRGMFHSIPAMLIAAEAAFLGYPSAILARKMLMAGGVLVGFFSHLVLDEIYSVEFDGLQPRLKRSSGTAIKMFGNNFLPNVFTFSLLLTTTMASLSTSGLLRNDFFTRIREEDNSSRPRNNRNPIYHDRFSQSDNQFYDSHSLRTDKSTDQDEVVRPLQHPRINPSSDRSRFENSSPSAENRELLDRPIRQSENTDSNAVRAL